MEGIIKCDSCGEQFDVDQLRFEDTDDKFTCPQCGSDKFKPLIAVEGAPSLPGSPAEKPAADLAGALRKMIRLMKEVHDQHIYGPDDQHDEDCRYCAAVETAEGELRKAR